MCMTGLTIIENTGLDGIRNKRKNGGRKPVISTDKKQRDGKRHSTEQVTQNIWLSQKYMEYQAVGYISFLTTGNECQSNADMENNSGFRYSIQTAKT